MIKMIAADMDGTLLNEKREISERTCKAIWQAYDAGIEFVIATGRGFASANEVLKDYDFKRSYILASGAEVRDCNAKVEKQVRLSHEICQKLYEICLSYPVTIHFCGNEFDYAVGSEETVRANMIKEFCEFTGIPAEECSETELFEKFWTNLIRVDCMEDMVNHDVYKAFIFSENIDMLGVLNQQLEQIPGIASASSFPTNLEITDINAQKGVALKELAEKRGLELSQVMALGDSLNDESMLMLPLGAAVAMENADTRIREICPFVTSSNDKDGVAIAIEHAIHGTVEQLRK